MSEKRTPTTHYCNFCGEGLDKRTPIPDLLTKEDTYSFKPKKDRDARWVTLKISVGLAASGMGEMDMCLDCQRTLAKEAADKMYGKDAIDGIRDSLSTYASRTDAALREIPTSAAATKLFERYLEANFGPMLDAHMAHRRSRKKAVA